MGPETVGLSWQVERDAHRLPRWTLELVVIHPQAVAVVPPLVVKDAIDLVRSWHGGVVSYPGLKCDLVPDDVQDVIVTDIDEVILGVSVVENVGLSGVGYGGVRGDRNLGAAVAGSDSEALLIGATGINGQVVSSLNVQRHIRTSPKGHNIRAQCNSGVSDAVYNVEVLSVTDLRSNPRGHIEGITLPTLAMVEVLTTVLVFIQGPVPTFG